MSSEVIGKTLEVLKEVVPQLSLVAVLWNPPPTREAPTIAAGHDAYGYAEAPRRRIDPNLFYIFGR
jgi:hypothetical protein